MYPGFVVAIDFEPKISLESLVELASSYASGVKIGLPYLLAEGKRIKSVLEGFLGLKIADMKLADIGFTMSLLAERAHEFGFDAVIAHAFVGVEKALDVLREKTKELGMKLFIVVAMSHPGAEELLNKNFSSSMAIASRIGADGIIAPATMPQYIKAAREKFGWKGLILSPGVGAQGAEPGSAVKVGANLEIIGRLITRAENPAEVMKRLSQLYEGLK